MSAKEKIVFCWSGGKDSALCLHRILQSDRYEILCLLTTLNEHYQRISMHGVRQTLLEEQADAIGLPLEKMFVSQRSTNEEYGEKMKAILLKYKALGAESVVFGDIFLEDLKRWREENLAKVGLKGLFPLWKIDTTQLIEEFITLGFGSVICCANDAYLDESFVGRKIDREFMSLLPKNVDPCGENGEYHSFAFEGPIFKKKLQIRVGEKVYRPVEQTHPGSSVCSSPSDATHAKPQTKGFWFCDLDSVKPQQSK
jgi:uncharacterized protein (TIGR00290 family)